MKAVFEGDNVLIFKPIQKGRGGRKKKQSNIERSLSGDKEALIDEIHDIIVWARSLSDEDWKNINHDADGGLRGFVSKVVEGQIVR